MSECFPPGKRLVSKSEQAPLFVSRIDPDITMFQWMVGICRPQSLLIALRYTQQNFF